jgi:inner membrane protein
MYRIGHHGMALLVYAPAGYGLTEFGPDPLLAFVGGAVVRSLATLPDVDLRLPLVSHRGPNHSLLFLAAVSAVLAGRRDGVDAVGRCSLGPLGCGRHRCVTYPHCTHRGTSGRSPDVPTS